MFKPIKYTTPRVNPSGNYELLALMRCQCRFISGQKYTAPVWDVDSGENNMSTVAKEIVRFVVALKKKKKKKISEGENGSYPRFCRDSEEIETAPPKGGLGTGHR